MTNQKEYAGFWIRVGASLLDSLIFTPFLFALAYLFGANVISLQYYDNVTPGQNLYDLISSIVAIAYIVLFLASSKQATIGKRICGIYVGRPDGSKITKSRALGRAFASSLSMILLGIGFIMIAFTKEKTGLHDLICDTRVFYGKIN